MFEILRGRLVWLPYGNHRITQFSDAREARVVPAGSRRMASRRTKSIGTKVTEEEYARIEALAGDQTISEWARAALLKGTDAPSDPTVLAELLALRTILLNLHFAICAGERVTAETMQRLIDRADHDKLDQARSRLVFGDRRR